ncbi:MAG: ABC transporter ATP-binding protein [Myxococcota bacterium]|nr:ABC transporter ATP-binding protein [Myxococcota bacterium]
MVTVAILTLLGGLLPAALAYVSKLIVDGIVLAIDTGAAPDEMRVYQFIVLEVFIFAALAGVQRGLAVCQSLLRAMLGHRVNVIILEKAIELDLAQFEDAEFYDSMNRARRGASSRPLGLINKTFGLIQNGISILTYGALLLQFSAWAVFILFLAALPAFFAETRFSGEAFRLFRWRAPESRQQSYLEWLMAREDFAKEVKLFGLGKLFLERYRAIFNTVFREDRALTMKRGLWGFLLGLLSIAAFYGAYGWIAYATVASQITLGEMTMYLLLFKQGQSSMTSGLSAINGMYEDNLYLSNLYEFLDYEPPAQTGTATHGLIEGDGIRFEHVSFSYPGSKNYALKDISFHLKSGDKLALVGENGSGKTTLIKLLTRLYNPTEGRILFDGLELAAWDQRSLHAKIGVIFQDFVRYQLTVGENIGVGDITKIHDEDAWRDASDKGMALPFIEAMPEKFETQLGRWFKDGRELSLGQWQKVALSRAFIQGSAQLLVLDEPTASMDAEAEARVFERFQKLAQNQMVILISHRFSTVRMADQILVLDDGQIEERGNHESLIASGGRYAHLFALQAAGYR